MNKYRFLYFIWFLPAYLLFMCMQQVVVHYSLIDTYKNGQSYSAEVLDMKVKQIATQTTGHITLKFHPKNSEEIQQKLTLPIEMAPEVARMDAVPIRYRKGAYENIVLIPAYKVQKDLVWTNFLMGLIAFLMTLAAAILVTRYANKKVRGEMPTPTFKRVDQ